MLSVKCGVRSAEWEANVWETSNVECRTSNIERGGQNTQYATRNTLLLCLAFACIGFRASAQDFFAEGTRAYQAGHYDQAAATFEQAVQREPSVGAWQNLGNAEWQRGNAGPAILAWERAQWLDPRDANAREDLLFARKSRLLDAPELPWYEVCSTWLQPDAWPWLACGSFWLALALVLLPNIFRWRKSGWHQALAAACFAIFLLTIPALAGVQTRSKLGVVLPHDAPLRLTPTADAQAVTRLTGGEIARLVRERGNYLFIRTTTGSGWIEREQFALITR
jgi:tetratricopeptide (TPR) repeat protein